MSADEEPTGIGNAVDPVVAHHEAADLVGGAEAVLGRPAEAQGAVLVALEGEDDVDEVLEQPRTGDRAVLGDMPDEHGGDGALLGEPDQRGGHFAHLGDAARCTVDLGRRDGLDRVEHQQSRADGVDLAQHRRQVGLGGEPEVGVDCVDPVGAQADLGGGLLTGDVQRRDAGARGPGGDVEQEGGLADARLTGEQDHASGDEPATQDAVELVDAGAAAPGGVDVDLEDGAGRGADGPSGHPARLGTGLVDRAPRLALTAPADPLGGRPAALGAAVVGACLLGDGPGVSGHVLPPRYGQDVRPHHRQGHGGPTVRASGCSNGCRGALPAPRPSQPGLDGSVAVTLAATCH